MSTEENLFVYSSLYVTKMYLSHISVWYKTFIKLPHTAYKVGFEVLLYECFIQNVYPDLCLSGVCAIQLPGGKVLKKEHLTFSLESVYRFDSWSVSKQ